VNSGCCENRMYAGYCKSVKEIKKCLNPPRFCGYLCWRCILQNMGTGTWTLAIFERCPAANWTLEEISSTNRAKPFYPTPFHSSPILYKERIHPLWKTDQRNISSPPFLFFSFFSLLDLFLSRKYYGFFCSLKSKLASSEILTENFLLYLGGLSHLSRISP